MSLRFLTRRRDRDRSNSILNSQPSPSGACIALPDQAARLGNAGYAGYAGYAGNAGNAGNARNAAVPADVHIISWDPRDLEAAGRDVHIRSRDPLPSPGLGPIDTPVYRAFTASQRLDHPPPVPAKSNPIRPQHAKSRARPKTASSVQDRQRIDFLESRPSLSAADDIRTDYLEVLQPSSTTATILSTQHDHAHTSNHSFSRRFASKIRRARSRSQQHGLAYDSGAETDADISHATLPASFASGSRIPYSHAQDNASVQSFASQASAHNREFCLLSPSNASSSFFSRLPNTRKLRRRQNASAADIQLLASSSAGTQPANDASAATSRSRSASLSTMAPKFLRPKDSRTDMVANAPPTPAKARLHRGAPPSAWRPDAAAAAAEAAAPGGSSTYSSDNDASAGSSTGHAHSLGATTSVGAASPGPYHAHLVSHPDAQHAHAQQLLGTSAHRPRTPVNRLSAITSALLPRTPDPESSPRPQSRHDVPSSPIIAGLPLSAKPARTASPAATNSLLASQLFKRLGPPPVGLEPHRFDERVLMIQHYIQHQVPLVPLAKPHDPVSIAPASNRSSLPPPARSSSATADARLAALADEFDKLECQTEHAMLELAAHKGDGVRVEIAELRLAHAFLAARRRCGVDSSRSHFELEAPPPAANSASPDLVSDPRFHADATPLRGTLGGMHPAPAVRPPSAREATDGLGGLGVSLRPAPRRRRRPITAPETQNKAIASMPLSSGTGGSRETLRRDGEAAGTRPSTARSSRSPAPASDTAGAALEGELFTPASFSARAGAGAAVVDADELRLRQMHAHAQARLVASRTVFAAPAHAYRRGSSDRDSSSSHNTATTHGSVRSPLFGAPAFQMVGWAGVGERQRTHSQDTADTEHTDASDMHAAIKAAVAREGALPAVS